MKYTLFNSLSLTLLATLSLIGYFYHPDVSLYSYVSLMIVSFGAFLVVSRLELISSIKLTLFTTAGLAVVLATTSFADGTGFFYSASEMILLVAVLVLGVVMGLFRLSWRWLVSIIALLVFLSVFYVISAEYRMVRIETWFTYLLSETLYFDPMIMISKMALMALIGMIIVRIIHLLRHVENIYESKILQGGIVFLAFGIVDLLSSTYVLGAQHASIAFSLFSGGSLLPFALLLALMSSIEARHHPLPAQSMKSNILLTSVVVLVSLTPLWVKIAPLNPDFALQCSDNITYMKSRYTFETALQPIVQKHAELLKSDGVYVEIIDPTKHERVASAKSVGSRASFMGDVGGAIAPIIMAIALENNITAAKDTIDCHNGAFKVDENYTIRDLKPVGVIPIEDVLFYGSQIGISQIALKIPEDVLTKGLNRFGLSQFPEPSDRAKLLYSLGYGIQNMDTIHLLMAYNQFLDPKSRAISTKTADTIQSVLRKKYMANSKTMGEDIPTLRIGGYEGVVRMKNGDNEYEKNQFQTTYIGFVDNANKRYIIGVAVANSRLPSEPNQGGEGVFREVIAMIQKNGYL